MIWGVILFSYPSYMERCGLGRWRREVFLSLGLFLTWWIRRKGESKTPLFLLSFHLSCDHELYDTKYHHH